MKKLITPFLIIATFLLFSPGIVSARQVQLYQKHLFTDPNLLSYWRMEGNSNDSKGTNNGSDTSVTYGTQYGIFGQGASFNGSSSGINLGSPSSLISLSGGSIVQFSSWIYLKAIPSSGNRFFIIRQGYEATSMWGMGVISTDGVNAYLIFRSSSPSTNGREQRSNTAITLNTWHFVTGEAQGGTSNAVLYIDGVQQSLTIVDGTNPNYVFNSSSANIYIGRDSNGDYWNGYIDCVSIFPRVLSAPEVEQIYVSGMTKHTTGRIFATKIVTFLVITLNLSETISNTDTFLKGLYRTFSEAITNTDTFLKGIYKTFTEAITNTDIFQSLKVLFTQFTEAVQSTDTLLRTMGKNLSEAVINTDVLLRAAGKSFSEAVTSTDAFSEIRMLVINFIEAIQNTDWLFLNGQLMDRWIRRVKGTVNWTKRNKPKQ